MFSKIVWWCLRGVGERGEENRTAGNEGMGKREGQVVTHNAMERRKDVTGGGGGTHTDATQLAADEYKKK